MRIAPILTALMAVAILFLLVFHRDSVLAVAGLAQTPAAETEAQAPEAAPAAATATEGPIAVVALESRAREIDTGLVLRGTTAAARAVELRAETSGRVVSEPRAKGSAVAEGDLLCEIDIGTRAAALAQAQAQLDQARLARDNAEALAGDGYASQSALIAARAGFEAAQAAVIAAEAEIDRTRITAPFAGVLDSDSAERGSLLSAGGLCATLIDLDPIRLVGYVPEAQVDAIVPGAAAAARLATGRQVIGAVRFVARAADPTTRTFLVEAEAANPDGAIRDGLSAEIIVQTPGRAAHLLPQSALTLADDGRLGVRIADDDDIARFAAVEMLRDSPEGVWVAGLPDVARVIVEGQDYVTDGVPVAVTLREATP